MRRFGAIGWPNGRVAPELQAKAVLPYRVMPLSQVCTPDQ